MGKIGAPAAAFGEAGHGDAAFGAVFLHQGSMARGMGNVKQGEETTRNTGKWGQQRGSPEPSRGELPLPWETRSYAEANSRDK